MSSQAQMGPKSGLARWSWRLGSIAGIETQVHASFLLILAWAAWNAWSIQPSVIGAGVAVLFVMALFGCVLLHELGHALMARRFGIGTRSITLLPIGGVAQLEGMPKDARQELWVAIAGPAVNVAIAAVLSLVLAVLGGLGVLVSGAAVPATVLGLAVVFLSALMWANIVLAVFNMLPAFPMDGGRVLRAALSMRSGDRLAATEIAVKVGKVLAVGLALYGLFVSGNPFLALIAVFVWFTGQRELEGVRREAELERMRRSMVIDPDTLAELRRWMAAGHGVIITTPDGRRIRI